MNTCADWYRNPPPLAEVKRAPVARRAALAPRARPHSRLAVRSRVALGPRQSTPGRPPLVPSRTPARSAAQTPADWRSARHAERCARHRASPAAANARSTRANHARLTPEPPSSSAYRHSRDSDAPARAPAVVVDAAPEMPRGGGGGKRKKKDETRSRETEARPRDGSDDAMELETDGKTLGERARDAERARARTDARNANERKDADEPSMTAAIRDALGDADASKPPRADSLATLFAQALVAEDRALIERCLSVGDAGVVSNTVARLPPAAVTKLLRAALDRMRSKPARGEGAARWMRAAMLHHASYIASSATAKTAVLELAQTVEAHQALQAPLQALLGRLDLLLHKQSEAKRARGGGASRGDDVSDDSDAEGPANVYDEGDEDLEDVMAEGDEESDWETDAEDASEGEEEEDSDDDESDSE